MGCAQNVSTGVPSAGKVAGSALEEKLRKKERERARKRDGERQRDRKREKEGETSFYHESIYVEWKERTVTRASSDKERGAYQHSSWVLSGILEWAVEMKNVSVRVVVYHKC